MKRAAEEELKVLVSERLRINTKNDGGYHTLPDVVIYRFLQILGERQFYRLFHRVSKRLKSLCYGFANHVRFTMTYLGDPNLLVELYSGSFNGENPKHLSYVPSSIISISTKNVYLLKFTESYLCKTTGEWIDFRCRMGGEYKMGGISRLNFSPIYGILIVREESYVINKGNLTKTEILTNITWNSSNYDDKETYKIIENNSHSKSNVLLKSTDGVRVYK